MTTEEIINDLIQELGDAMDKKRELETRIDTLVALIHHYEKENAVE